MAKKSLSFSILSDEPGFMSAAFHIGYSSNDLVQIYNKNWFLEIEDVIVHPEFGVEIGADEKPLVVNDIALIKLRQPLRFSNTVQPACLGLEHKEKYETPLMVG